MCSVTKLSMQLRADHAGRRFERNLSSGPGDLVGETRKATRAVAAHLRFAAVGIVITHAKIRAVRRFLQQQNSIRPDAAMPIANPRNLRRASR